MRVAIVETYPVDGDEFEFPQSAGRRESEMALMLERLGNTVECFKTTRSPVVSEVCVGPVRWRFMPVDDSGRRDHQVRSSKLLSALRQFDMQLLILKGVGTIASREVLRLPVQMRVAVIGGAYQSRELWRCDLVLTEKPIQTAFVRSLSGEEAAMQLSKLAGREFFDAPQRAPTSGHDVVAVGRLIPLKNLSILRPLVEAGFSVGICGDGPERARLEASLTVGDRRAVFHGQLSAVSLAHLVSASRLLAHPSVDEGFPRAVAEAMAAGTPPVVLKGVVDSPFLNEHNSVTTDTEHFCSEIERLLGDSRRLDRMSRESRAVAEREFSLDRLEGTLSRVIECLSDIDAARRQSPVRARLADVERWIRWSAAVWSRRSTRALVRTIDRSWRIVRGYGTQAVRMASGRARASTRTEFGSE